MIVGYRLVYQALKPIGLEPVNGLCAAYAVSDCSCWQMQTEDVQEQHHQITHLFMSIPTQWRLDCI